MRSRAKLTVMRGENCIEARVSVISRIANTIETTVIVEVAMSPRITCATPGSECEKKRTRGTQSPMEGSDSSIQETTAPLHASTSAIVTGRTRNPPRKL